MADIVRKAGGTQAIDIGAIVNKVLEALKTQTDMKGTTELSGSVTVDPAQFMPSSSATTSQAYKHNVSSLIVFQTTYSAPPTVVLTQYSDIISSDVRVSQTGTNYTPFLVQPYVYNWNWTNGVVDGFYIGMYALTDPVQNPHSSQIVWKSSGVATRYLNPNTTEKWTREDNSMQPHYLAEDATSSIEKI